MPVFPLFIDLKGKSCVVVGGGNVAERKIRTLLEFGAEVTVVSLQISADIKKMEQQGRVAVKSRGYRTGDLKGAFIAIAATSDRCVNEDVYNDAVRSGIFVNVADGIEKSTFVFPSTIRRGDLVIGISTSGSCPALSKHLRKKIEDTIPGNYGDVLEVLKEHRDRIINEVGDAAERKKVLNSKINELERDAGCLSGEQPVLKTAEMFEELKNDEED